MPGKGAGAGAEAGAGERAGERADDGADKGADEEAALKRTPGALGSAPAFRLADLMRGPTRFNAGARFFAAGAGFELASSILTNFLALRCCAFPARTSPRKNAAPVMRAIAA